MGMDEHSQSVIQAAARAGVSPQQWVDRMAGTFADYWRRLHCNERRLDPYHGAAARPCGGGAAGADPAAPPGDLFEAEYEGLYCTGCEEFKTGAQIVDGIAWSIPHSS